MPTLLALDVAVLLPDQVRRQAVALSAALPTVDGQGLRLDDDQLPHLTLTQQFIRTADQLAALDAVAETLRAQSPFTLRVTGGGTGGNTVWMAIERSPELVELHERLMATLQRWEHRAGATDAFSGHDARQSDVRWVTHYREKHSFNAFAPHVTLGHARQPPTIEPFSLHAAVLAACHLGRFCTCRRVLRQWNLGNGPSD